MSPCIPVGFLPLFKKPQVVYLNGLQCVWTSIPAPYPPAQCPVFPGIGSRLPADLVLGKWLWMIDGWIRFCICLLRSQEEGKN